jgi:ATP-binding cassette subfamily B protein
MRSKSNIKESFKLFIQFAREIRHADKHRIFVTILVYTALPLSSIVFDVLLLRYIVDNYNDNFKWEQFIIIMFGVLLFQIIVWLLESYYVQYYSENSNLKVSQYFYFKLFKKIDKTPLSNFENKEYYDRYYFILNNTENRVSGFISIIENFVSSFIMLFTISLVVFLYGPLIIIFVIIPLVFEYILTPYINKRKFSYNKEMSNIQRKGDYAQRVLYLKDYAKEVRTTKIKNVIYAQYDHFISDAKRLVRIYGLKIGLLQFFVNFSFQIVSFIGAIIYITYRVLSGYMDMGSAIVIVSTFNQIIYSVKNIVDIYMSSMEQAMYIKDMFSFFSAPEKSQPNQNEYESFPLLIETLEFKNVCYQYQNGNKEALNDVSFIVQKGQRIALLGPNGAGKSTMIKLIMRLYEPTSGEILINGININRYKLEEYKQKISSVKQKFIIFATDLEHNILFKSIENTQEQNTYINAIEKSSFLEKHAQLKNGSKTIVTKEFDKEGEIFSGGEMQKLAIARAIANESDVIIMDEPTSALDPVSESVFMQMIFENFEDRILFIVSHSFSMAKKADKILFLMDGRLKESGTHAHLMSLNGSYAGYFKIQAEYFENKGVI